MIETVSEKTESPTESPVVRLTATVQGHVQGVGFRYWAHHTATALALPGGQVRNLPDGSVEVIAEAPNRDTLERLLVELHSGPTSARVDSVDALWEEGADPRFPTVGLQVA